MKRSRNGGYLGGCPGLFAIHRVRFEHAGLDRLIQDRAVTAVYLICLCLVASLNGCRQLHMSGRDAALDRLVALARFL